MDKDRELQEQLKYLRLQAFLDHLEDVESSNKGFREALYHGRSTQNKTSKLPQDQDFVDVGF